MLDREAGNVGFLDALRPVALAARREHPGKARVRAGAEQGARDDQEAETGDQPGDGADVEHGVWFSLAAESAAGWALDEVGAMGEAAGRGAGPADEPHRVDGGEREADQ